jgi:hypothetical protein
MKNLYLLLFVLLFACKEKEVKPESKSAPLLIEFTANYSSPIYCNLFLSPLGDNSEYFTTDTSNNVVYAIDKPQFKGGRTINFGSTAHFSTGQTMVYGNYSIKVTYNGQVLANQNFINNSGVSVNVALPTIE